MLVLNAFPQSVLTKLIVDSFHLHYDKVIRMRSFMVTIIK
jgi:hypothetical protein